MSVSALNIVIDNAIVDKIISLETENNIMRKKIDAIDYRAHDQYYVYNRLTENQDYDFSDYNTASWTKEFKLAYGLRNGDEDNNWHNGFYEALSQFTRLMIDITEPKESFREAYNNERMTVEDMLTEALLPFDDIYIGDAKVRKEKTTGDIVTILNVVLNKGTNEKMKYLLKEHNEMRLRLNAISDVCKNAEKWYFCLVWMARGWELDEFIFNFPKQDRDRLLKEITQISNDDNYSHGFNSGILAAATQYGQIATADNMVLDRTNICNQHMERLIAYTIDKFPDIG